MVTSNVGLDIDTRLFASISEDEKKMIEYHIDENIEEGCSCNVTLDYLLREWSLRKESLFNMFGGKLILSREYEYEISDEELQQTIGDEIYRYSSDIGRFIKDFKSMAISSEDHYEPKFYDLINTEALAKNIYEGETFETIFPNGQKYRITHGQKLSRALGKIANAYNITSYEAFRIRHSQILNQKKLSGMMHLSIHPLDYMTMSDNECGWSSCMSWREEGCYRQGTVEMMNSPYVVVAYLDSKTSLSYPNGLHWNSKKWRELYIVDDDIIANVKGYPYRNEDFTHFILSWLKEIHPLGNEFRDKCFKYNEGGLVADPDTQEIVVDRVYFRTEYMYNDFSSDQFCYLHKDAPSNIDICYSGASECMCCGSIHIYVESEGNLCCEDCYKDYSACCDLCGEEYDADESYYVDDSNICPWCYDNHVVTDTVYGEEHIDDNMLPIRIKMDDMISDVIDVNLYQGDIGYYRANSAFNKVRTSSNKNAYWTRINYIDINDLTEEDIEDLECDDIEDVADMVIRDFSYSVIKVEDLVRDRKYRY